MRSSRRQSNPTSSPPPSWPAAFVDKINNEFDNNRSENHSISKSFIDEGDSIPRLRAFAISDPYSNLLEKDTMTDGTSFVQNFPVQPTIPTEIRKNEFTSYRPTGWYQLQNEDGIETRGQAGESPFHDPVLPRRSKSLPNPPSSPPPPFTQPSPQINHRPPNLITHAINNTGENLTPIQQKHSTNQLLSTLGAELSPLRLPEERINSRPTSWYQIPNEDEIETRGQAGESPSHDPETNQEMEFRCLSEKSLTFSAISYHRRHEHETITNKNYVADLNKKSFQLYKPAPLPQESQTNKQINSGKISVLHQQNDSTQQISSPLHNEPNAFPVSSMDNRTDFESQSSQPATNIQPSAIKEGKAKRNQSSVQILDVSMKLPNGVYLEVLNGKCSLLNISMCDSASLTIRWGVASTQETLPVEVLKVVANYVTHGLYVGIHGSSLLQVNIERTKNDEIKFERKDEHFFITLPENVSFEKHPIEPEEPQYQVLMEEISLDQVTLSNHPLKCKSDSCNYFALSRQGLCWHCNNELQKWSSSFASAMKTSITASQSDIHCTASHFNISTTGQTKDTFNATLTCINCKAAMAANNDNGFCNNCFLSKK